MRDAQAAEHGVERRRALGAVRPVPVGDLAEDHRQRGVAELCAQDCDEAAELGPVAFGMCRIGLALMPQHGREVAPVACGADAFDGFGQIVRFGAGQPLVDRRAAAGVDHDAHRGARDLRIACGEATDGADALHAELLADGGVAVHGFRGAFEAVAVEEVDAAERVGGLGIHRTPARHVRLPDAEDEPQARQPHEADAAGRERIARHGAGFYDMFVREFDARGVRGTVGHVDRIGTGAGRCGEAQGRCQQESAFHGRQWLR